MKLTQGFAFKAGFLSMVAIFASANISSAETQATRVLDDSLDDSEFVNSETVNSEFVNSEFVNSEYVELYRMDALIQRGVGLHNLALLSEQEPAELSLWQFGECRPFVILGVRYLEGVASNEWKDADVKIVRNVAHYSIPSKFTHLQLRTQTDSFFAFNCSLSIRKAKFTLPNGITKILAKLKTPECSIDEVGRATCKFSVDRIDQDSVQTYIVLERDVKKFNLQSGKVYQLSGFLENINEADVFMIEGARLIQK
jgi:hypothetical protein